MRTFQRIIKYLAIAFAFYLIFIIFMCLYNGLNLMGGVIGKRSDGDVFQISELSEDTNILNLEIGLSELKIVEGETLKVETDNDFVKVEQTGNKVIVKETNHSLFKTNDKCHVVVTIPKDLILDKAYISNGAGTIDIENLQTKELKLVIRAGSIKAKNLTTTQDTKIEGGAGEVVLENANLTNLDLEVGFGKFTMTSILKGKSQIEAGVGELNINLVGSKENYTIKPETGIGSITIDGETVKGEKTIGSGENEVEIEGGIGSVNIKFQESEEKI